MKKILVVLMLICAALPAWSQNGPLRLTITDGVIEPLPFALPSFQAESVASIELARGRSSAVHKCRLRAKGTPAIGLIMICFCAISS